MKKPVFSVKELALCGLFCALMIVGANIRIAINPIPVTFQAFFAILSGLLLGSKMGAMSQVAYIILGLVGLPVFANGSSGPAYVLQPTFGYLVGFALAAFLSGLFIEKKQKLQYIHILVAALMGLLVIYAFGITYTWMIKDLYLAKPVGLDKLIAGMFLFFIKDLILFVAASAVAFRLIPLVKKFK
jgi:biotin transport system substrate-specific component